MQRLTLFAFRFYREDCQQQVTGFIGNKHQKFATLEDAKSYLSQHGIVIGSDVLKPHPASSLSSPGPSTLRNGSHGQKPYSQSVGPVSKVENKANGSNSRWAALSTEKIQDESGWEVVYSDGACKGKGKAGSVAGTGVWWGRDDPRYGTILSSPAHINS